MCNSLEGEREAIEIHPYKNLLFHPSYNKNPKLTMGTWDHMSVGVACTFSFYFHSPFSNLFSNFFLHQRTTGHRRPPAPSVARACRPPMQLAHASRARGQRWRMAELATCMMSPNFDVAWLRGSWVGWLARLGGSIGCAEERREWRRGEGWHREARQCQGEDTHLALIGLHRSPTAQSDDLPFVGSRREKECAPTAEHDEATSGLMVHHSGNRRR
jgi:hypothetical protein